MTILDRNQESSWVYIVSEDKKTGWVAASLLTIDGDLKQVSIKAGLEVSSLAPTSKPLPTATRNPLSEFGISNTQQPVANPFRAIPLCSDTANKIGEYVSCEIPRAYCDWRPEVNGGPTFCDDKPYPNQDFQLVVWGEDWSDFDGLCIVVSGYIETYRGVLQMEPTSREQVAYCK